ncbi:hypothetical protein PMAYCL1PPCAC_25612 [Pristionchus mayeri]|uniref:Uncharacterized protein n=1 Tax=Pristionchus mayeri TaxID=1317129 RepID=A0AAN5D498_9BILA|nr:hypothetical protein PMAYCL1PPCAC_25611 [Pristionchus mayeri]GMR55417.1 hypothetical protein PMAYCL1PPCAC_25612 [Pristionchus mayeri]
MKCSSVISLRRIRKKWKSRTSSSRDSSTSFEISIITMKRCISTMSSIRFHRASSSQAFLSIPDEASSEFVRELSHPVDRFLCGREVPSC